MLDALGLWIFICMGVIMSIAGPVKQGGKDAVETEKVTGHHARDSDTGGEGCRLRREKALSF